MLRRPPVREGQAARVRLTAFNRTTTPEMKAKVTMVSPATAKDPANDQEHYIAYVQLVQDALLHLKGIRLLPGMPAEVYISTQERTAALYLTKPFTDQMNRAFSSAEIGRAAFHRSNFFEDRDLRTVRRCHADTVSASPVGAKKTTASVSLRQGCL